MSAVRADRVMTIRPGHDDQTCCREPPASLTRAATGVEVYDRAVQVL